MADVQDEALEFVLLQKPEVIVYKIPNRPSSGHRAEEWKDAIWRGKLRVAAKENTLTAKLIDKTTDSIFAACPVGDRVDQAIERTVDSSRYFALRIDDGRGRHAYVGMGFEERSDAFDFNATLCDFVRRRDAEKEDAEQLHAETAHRDYRLQEGQKIKMSIKGLSTTARKKQSKDDDVNHSASIISPLLPPPPDCQGRTRHGKPAFTEPQEQKKAPSKSVGDPIPIRKKPGNTSNPNSPAAASQSMISSGMKPVTKPNIVAPIPQPAEMKHPENELDLLDLEFSDFQSATGSSIAGQMRDLSLNQ